MTAIQKAFMTRVHQTESCWFWKLGFDGQGYGLFRFLGRMFKAHRFIYELTYGEIEQGKYIDHKCNNRNCVNPQHLEAVTNVENIMRGSSPIAANAKKTHCPKNHPYDEFNTLFTKQGRKCKACKKLKSAEWMRKVKNISHNVIT